VGLPLGQYGEPGLTRLPGPQQAPLRRQMTGGFEETGTL